MAISAEQPALPGQAAPTAAWRWIAAGVAFLLLIAFVVARFDAVGTDLQAYLDAARRLLDGMPLYQPVTQQGTFQPGPEGMYLYAPPLAVATIPLELAGPTTANAIWLGIHLLAVALTAAILPVRLGVRLAVLIVAAGMYPVANDAVLGNVSIIVMTLAAVTWRWLDRPVGALALAVSISLRPTQGIVLIWWLLRRQWRPILWTCIGGGVLVALTLPVVGLDGYGSYLTVIRNLGDGVGVRLNMGFAALASAAGIEHAWAVTLQFLGYALAIGALILGLRRDREVGYMVAIGGSLLLSPLLWVHYLTLAILPAALLADRGRPLPLILLAPLTWVPVLTHTGEFVYPALAVAATLLPLLAPAPRAPVSMGAAQVRLAKQAS